MSYAMSPAEREQFLKEPHVGVLSVVENGAPLTVPVWYEYQPGGPVSVITGQGSRKAGALEATGWLSLCVQDETWPYKYVTASGPAAIRGQASQVELRAMATRYLGDAGADEYMAEITASGGADGQIVIEMSPQVWLTVDYAKES